MRLNDHEAGWALGEQKIRQTSPPAERENHEKYSATDSAAIKISCETKAEVNSALLKKTYDFSFNLTNILYCYKSL